MNALFENYLKEFSYYTITDEYITHEEQIRLRGYNVDEIRQKVRDDFLIYRYYMKDCVLTKDYFYMQFKGVSYDGNIRYVSRISDSNKTCMEIWEDDISSLTGPVTKLHRYVYRLTEDDDAVIKFFLDQECIKQQKLLDELDRVTKSIQNLSCLRP